MVYNVAPSLHVFVLRESTCELSCSNGVLFRTMIRREWKSEEGSRGWWWWCASGSIVHSRICKPGICSYHIVYNSHTGKLSDGK